jgi:hypothetical protein
MKLSDDPVTRMAQEQIVDEAARQLFPEWILDQIAERKRQKSRRQRRSQSNRTRRSAHGAARVYID